MIMMGWDVLVWHNYGLVDTIASFGMNCIWLLGYVVLAVTKAIKYDDNQSTELVPRRSFNRRVLQKS